MNYFIDTGCNNNKIFNLEKCKMNDFGKNSLEFFEAKGIDKR